MLIVAAAVAGVAAELSSHESLVGWWVAVAALGPLFAVIFAARSLAGTDVVLERSVPRLTGGRRIAHAGAVLTVCCVPLALAGAATLDAAATAAMVRNVLGLLGMMLLAATVAGVRAGWLPVFGYGLLALATAPRDTSRGAAWWAWTVQPGLPNVSWIVAGVLAVAGVAVYGRRGPAE
ncbi:hypothetical protein [Actinoplanes sp. ATCC 53533]|uniref:hypothetical protein n=1 Tax=Actinoplanes sp. ATCC 53533 TaxID=1288362 RepID=UPI000F7A2025|nr:hypothetical protein [Actinoplanes sp. ATCC 53533]